MSKRVDELLEGRSEEAQRFYIEEADREAERRRIANPLRYYVPNGWSEKLIRAFGEEKGKWIFIMPAANSIGKTSTAITILGNLIWGIQSPWFDFERFRNWDGPKKCWYISENSTLKDFVCGTEENQDTEIKKWFPKGRFQFYKSGLEFFSRLHSDTNWVVSFKTYDMDPGKFESDKISLIIFDEPPPETIFNACLARLFLGGSILVPMTPLYQSAWIKDRLIDGASEKSPVYVAYGDIEEGCKDHGIRGRLDHNIIEAIISQYDPDEVEARAHGRFMHLSGLVLKGIDPVAHRHDISPYKFGQDEFRIYCVMDPHDAWPPVIGWFGVDKWKNVWAIDEYPEDDYHTMKNFRKTTREICQDIAAKEKEYKWDGAKIKRIIDPNFGVKPIQAVGMTVRDYYAKCGREIDYPFLNFSPDVNDNLEAGHKMVKDWLAKSPDGDVRLKIGMKCNNIWRDMNRYSIRPISAKRLETDGMTEMVAMKFKAGVDILRYLFMFLKPPEEQAEKIDPKDLPWYAHLLPNLGQRSDDEPADWRDPWRI